MSTIEIAVDDPRRDDVRRLLERHWDLASELSPPEHVHTLSVDQLLDPTVTLFSVRDGRALVGVGALKELDPTHGELKSMHVAAEVRRKGVGRVLVDHLLEVARARGYARVSLETGSGDGFEAALALYRAAGFARCEPFGEYTVNAFSVCMTITLA